MKLLAAFAVSLQLAALTYAQQPTPSPVQIATPNVTPEQTARPTGDDVVRITTNLVQVDAVVTDKNGNPVTDLRQDEVQILEDGQPQKITHFSFVSLTPTTNTANRRAALDENAYGPPLPLRPEQVKRTIAVVVDDLGLSFESGYFVRRALKKFVDEQIQPGDLVAIIRTGGGMGALQQFTSDKRQLYAAVERVKWNAVSAPVGPFGPIGASPGRFTSETSGEDIDELRQDIFAVGTLGALNYVIRGMADLPGRKSVLLVSDGMRIFSRSDPMSSPRILGALRALADRATRASVVIYTMDARGVPTLGLTAADSNFGMTPDQFEQQLVDRRTDYFESQNGLNYLAERTGGFFIHDTNDLGNGIRRVIEDQKSYYLIGYRPDESTFDTVSGRRRFHKLGLKVLRQGRFNVRIRSGFYGVSDNNSATIGTPRQRVIEALTSPFGSAGVHLRLTSLFANDATNGSVIRSMLHIAASDLTFTEQPDGWHQATFDVIFAAFGDNGVVADQLSRTHSIRAKDKGFERLLQSGFVYNVTFPLKKAGAYQLRTALRDRGSERIGSASQFVEVPDIKKNRLTASGVAVRAMSLEAYTRLQQGGQRSASDDSVDSDPGADPSMREFHNGTALIYQLTVYNAKLDKATGKPSLQIRTRLFRDGKEYFAGREMPYDPVDQKDLKRLNVVGAIQLGTNMQTGEYILQVLVTDLLAKEKNRLTTQWIGFEIIK